MTAPLGEILDAAVDEGFLTRTAASDGIEHSEGFLGFGPEDFAVLLGVNDLAIDLGTGGGLPGLVLATQTDNRWLLVDRGTRRCRFLRWAVGILEISDRVEIMESSVEELARTGYRGRAMLVTARSFGAPAKTAECAAPLLRTRGILVVSEPPQTASERSERWPAEGLNKLGLSDVGHWHTGSHGYRAFVCDRTCPPDFPRRMPKIVADPLF